MNLFKSCPLKSVAQKRIYDKLERNMEPRRGWEKAGKTSFNEDLGEFIKFYPNIFVDCQ